MIDKIHIQNFKSIKDSDVLDLKGINILTGLNGMGKSSFIQSLLLLRQSTELGQGVLDLKGNLVNVGTSSDVRSVQSDSDEITFSIQSNKDKFIWTFDCAHNSDRITDQSPSHKYSTQQLQKISLFNDLFQYIASDRIAQQELHTASQSSIEKGFLGTKGEYTVHYLDAIQSGAVGHKYETPKVLRHSSFEDNGSLNAQAEAWLGEVSPGVRINITKITSDLLKLGFSFGNLSANPFKPFNVGFGISYSLSVIVSLLTSRPGSLTIIENPEAHLHPQGQAKLAELICKAARNGAQIIIETHSDHIINGIRVMNRAYYNDVQRDVSESQRLGISNEDVAVFWFERNPEDFSSRIVPVRIEPNARVKNAPAGFFDQIEIDLKKILGF